MKALKELKLLDLVGTPLSELPNYKEKVFEEFKDLLALDGFTKEGEEIISDMEFGEGEGGESDLDDLIE